MWKHVVAPRITALHWGDYSNILAGKLKPPRFFAREIPQWFEISPLQIYHEPGGGIIDLLTGKTVTFYTQFRRSAISSGLQHLVPGQRRWLDNVSGDRDCVPSLRFHAVGLPANITLRPGQQYEAPFCLMRGTYAVVAQFIGVPILFSGYE